jgi:hypothetical protein
MWCVHMCTEHGRDNYKIWRVCDVKTYISNKEFRAQFVKPDFSYKTSSRTKFVLVVSYLDTSVVNEQQIRGMSGTKGVKNKS